ncbi:MAG TPA: homoserine kinase [Candidatus Limnocylindrales bacterium]|nr:homoserine kinase [Candidatus Limnocylindrales bacterium]
MVTNWLAELDGRRVAVEVPATSANLGAGYDCLGMAFELTNRVGLEVRSWSRDGIELSVEGEGDGELPADGRNRFVQGVEAAIREARGGLPEGASWRIEMVNRIPLARGLGSSAAATVGGLLAANALLGDALSQAELLRLATKIEGHPDNAAAALLGGFVVSAMSGDAVEAIRFDVPRGIRAVVFIPELRLATAEMRKVLPAKVPRPDAVANLARVAIGVAGFATGRRDLIGLLTEDRLHEPYRAAVYPQLPRMVAEARSAGALGAYLSGAGSSIVAFVDTVSGVARIESAFRAAAADTDLPGRVEVVAPRNSGAKVIPEL